MTAPPGQSAAVRSGVLAARGGIIATMDGDGQNDPVYLPKLVEALEAAGPKIGIAAGQRLKRKDTKLKQLASRFANGLRQSILQGQHARFRLRPQGRPRRHLPPAALFRRLAPLHAGAGAARRAMASSTST